MGKTIATMIRSLSFLWFSTNLVAATVVGTFNIAGTVTFTPNTTTWTGNVSPFPPDKAGIGPNPTGIYSALGGTTVTINDLNRATEPVGVSFTAQPFIGFDAAPALSPLLVNFIFTGIYDPAGCAATPPDVGQTCTPSLPGAASPFSFTNTSPPPTGGGPGSSAAFVVEGVSANGAYTWSGAFTLPFGTFFQAVLAAFAPGGSGSVTTTFSAAITVSQANPLLSISKTHSGTFTQGGTGEWDVTVSNTGPATTGTTTVSDTLPTGYTVANFSTTSASWSCMGMGTNTATCTSTSAINGGTSFPTIRIIVNIPAASPASVTNTAKAYGGGDTVHATLATGVSASDTVSVILAPALAFTATSATTSDFDDAATVSAKLSDAGTGVPNKTVTFVLGAGTGTETCSGTTDASGVASCSITPNQAAGMYTLTATFAGDASDAAASASTTFTITREETTVTFAANSPTVIANGHSVTLSAVLKEDGVTPIPGRNLTLTLGGTQSCSGTTDATGTGTCTIAVVNQPLGPTTVTANFPGDSFYLPSSASEQVTLFAFLRSGSMTAGNLNAVVGAPVEFWGADWAVKNSLSGGTAPDSFKGFAGAAPQSCGGSWTATPGNSSHPPATVPSYVGVIASSSITQSGNTISGNAPMIIVVKTNPGYSGNPGHPGTGTVVAVFCH